MHNHLLLAAIVWMAPAGLRNILSVEQWLKNIQLNSNKDTVLPGLVPAFTYLLVDGVYKNRYWIDLETVVNS